MSLHAPALLTALHAAAVVTMYPTITSWQSASYGLIQSNQPLQSGGPAMGEATSSVSQQEEPRRMARKSQTPLSSPPTISLRGTAVGAISCATVSVEPLCQLSHCVS
jgi:hypothetical protein